MQTEITNACKSYVIKLLEEKLPKELTFHNLQHTLDVAQYAEYIGKGEKLTQSELEIVIIAALFHDVGYTEQYIGHEEESQNIAEKFLLDIGYDEEKIKIVKDCIIATKFRHESKNILESVLIDADRFHMARIDFMEKGESLRSEWAIYLDKTYSEKDWCDTQLQYLNETQFLTKFCQRKYSSQKILNYKQLKELSLKFENEEKASITNQSKIVISQTGKFLKSIALSMILGLFIGVSLSITVWGLVGYSFIIGSFSGVIIGTILQLGDATFEYRILRKYSFPIALVLGTVILIFLFKIAEYLAVAIYDIVFTDITLDHLLEAEGLREIFRWSSFKNMLWTGFMMSIIINFFKLTSRIIGPKLMINYISGRYHRPRAEERIFMFLDLNSSTTIAEKMNTEKYHQFLNRFFYDIASPISRYDGEIYQYVGDEVVVTWKMKDGIKNSNCIRCYFRIERQLKKLEQSYMQQFGIAPQFKVSFHGGRVITGEVGKIKTEIVFHGDVINTTERILSQCILLNKRILISENLLRRIDLLPYLKAEYVTTKTFKGKENETSLYTIVDSRYNE